MTDEAEDLQILEGSLLTGADAKRTFSSNYMKILLQKHPALKLEYIINFLAKCQMTGANPLLDEVYLIERKTKNNTGGWDVVGSVVFNYRYFIQKAKENPDFNGFTTETGVADYFNPNTGETVKTLFCKATVNMKTSGSISFTAFYPEFVQLKDEYIDNKKTGKREPSGLWREKPRFMIEKCAIANCVRWAAPAELSGLYIEEEMGLVEHVEERREKAIEAEAKNVGIAKKIEKMVDNTENFEEIQNQIGIIKIILGQLTDGMPPKDKGAFMLANLDIKAFKELNAWSLENLVVAHAKLFKMREDEIAKKEAIITTALTTKDIPF